MGGGEQLRTWQSTQSSWGPQQAGGTLSKCHALRPKARVRQRRPALPPVSWGVAAEVLSGPTTQGPGRALNGPDKLEEPGSRDEGTEGC